MLHKIQPNHSDHSNHYNKQCSFSSWESPEKRETLYLPFLPKDLRKSLFVLFKGYFVPPVTRPPASPARCRQPCVWQDEDRPLLVAHVGAWDHLITTLFIWAVRICQAGGQPRHSSWLSSWAPPAVRDTVLSTALIQTNNNVGW